ncbi:MAG: HNH endonuclease [Mycoplasma sp.]|nr:HNH endonuclease [Mycoplasma sp.]
MLKERQEEKTKSQIWIQAITKYTKNQKWIDCTNEKVELYKKGIIEKDKLKISLRNIYTTFANIRYQEACNKNILVYESENIEYENAHIVQFSYYFNNEEFLKATDPNNLLFLDPNTHKIYDKNKITINLEGIAEINPNLSKLDREIIEKQYKDKQIISPDWLKFEYQNSMPYKYLKINYKYWKNYKKNLQ